MDLFGFLDQCCYCKSIICGKHKTCLKCKNYFCEKCKVSKSNTECPSCLPNNSRNYRVNKSQLLEHVRNADGIILDQFITLCTMQKKVQLYKSFLYKFITVFGTPTSLTLNREVINKIFN